MINTIRSVYTSYHISQAIIEDVKKIYQSSDFMSYAAAGGLLATDTGFFRVRAAMPEIKLKTAIEDKRGFHAWEIRQGDLIILENSQAEALKEFLHAII
jgi:hypothetical protein